MQFIIYRNRSKTAIRALLRSKPHLSQIRCMQTRTSRRIESTIGSETSLVKNGKGPLAFLQRLSRKKVDENWIYGPEVVVYHVPKVHIFHRLSAYFPAFVIFATLFNLDTIWNHGLVENPEYDEFHPTPEQPQYIPKPLGEKMNLALVTVGACGLALGGTTALRRRVIRTVTFRTDHPRKVVLQGKIPTLKPTRERRMVCLTSVSGVRYCYPIGELRLSDAKRQDTLFIKAQERTWPFLFEVEAAQMGWPGITSMIEPFVPKHPQAERKAVEEERRIHNLYAKQLFGLLWRTHSGVNLS